MNDRLKRHHKDTKNWAEWQVYLTYFSGNYPLISLHNLYFCK